MSSRSLAAQHGRDDPTALTYAALPLSVLGSNPSAGARLIDRADLGPLETRLDGARDMFGYAGL